MIISVPLDHDSFAKLTQTNNVSLNFRGKMGVADHH